MQQPPALGKVDIVFVADTSGSLSDEQDAVAVALERLVTGIDPQGDYHIGVLPAHGSLGPTTGRLWKGEIDGIYRFTYQRFHSGDSGPPKLKICNFDVVAP